MIRDLTKSALSFSWALSLLGAEQAINLVRAGQKNRGNVLEPMAQVAASQLDESLKGIYRTGDSMQRGIVDTAFSLFNPTGWINPSNWTNIAGAVNPGNWAGASGSAGKGMADMMNPMNWMNPGNSMPNTNDCGCGGRPSRAAQSTNASSNQPSGPAASASVANESATGGWGPPNS
jgi:hypothetical protein